MKKLFFSILLLGIQSILATSVSGVLPVSSSASRTGLEDERIEKIAFYSKRSGNCQIYLMNADGSGFRRLTDGSVNEFPCWSPDGKRIAFQSARDGNFEIYVMNADGSEHRRLTNDPGFDGTPSWGVVKMPSGKCP